jgi:hypothetical protein
VKGIVVGVADLRRKPKFRSERISQLIYGEEVRTLGSEEDYYKAVGRDGYEGYVQKSLVGDLEGDRAYKTAARHRADGLQFPFGSYLSEREAKRFKVPRKLLVSVDRGADPASLALDFLGVPYLWGGTSDFGYDCSGFTQRLFRYSGIELPRNAGWQRDAGEVVDGFDAARRGDLVFFTGHVALYLGGRKIVHANLSHGGVSITDLSDGSEYSKRLLGILQGVRRFEGADFGRP